MKRSASTQDVVIGSGSGGAVLAARLAEGGRDVVLLEEGPRVSRLDFTQREGAMYSLLYRDAGGQSSADGAISVLQGRCLGGSTTINMGDVVPIEMAVLNHWRGQFGWGDWGGISDADVQAAALRAKRDMGANRIAPDAVNRANGLLRDGAKALGLSGQRLEHTGRGVWAAATASSGVPTTRRRARCSATCPARRRPARWFGATPAWTASSPAPTESR